MAQYDYLLFDVDNTLLDFNRAEHEALMDCFDDFGIAREESLVQAYSRINDRFWKMLEKGEIDRPTLLWKRFEVFAQECGLGAMDPHAFCEHYVSHLSEKSYLMDGALELCRSLSERYTLCAVTNGNARVQHGRFDPSPLYPYFKFVFISEELGADKPSQAYFDLVQKGLGYADPARMLVIGDSLSSDIAGGILWGCDTCWLCPNEDRRGKAAEMGLDPTYTVAHLNEIPDILKA